MPLISGEQQDGKGWTQRIKMHETLLLTLILALETTGYILSAFGNKLWQYYAIHFFFFMSYCKYGTARALISKCISEDEVGKAFSLIAVTAALIPFVSNPAMRQLYRATVETFPGAFSLFKF